MDLECSSRAKSPGRCSNSALQQTLAIRLYRGSEMGLGGSDRNVHTHICEATASASDTARAATVLHLSDRT